MSTAIATTTCEPSTKPILQRIGEVRRQQGVSQQCAARKWGVDINVIRTRDLPETDLLVSELLDWTRLLEVPPSELLPDLGPVRSPINDRAAMVKLAKTAATILEQAIDARPPMNEIRRLATMLREQLVALMPELEQIETWPKIGHRRTLDEMGKITHVAYPSTIRLRQGRP